jgi:polysaccharide chain length determinant protein (PEP-CTERM system associated)
MQSWRLELFANLSAIWQYRWQGLAAAWAVCILGWLGVATIPNTYESTAEVYIDTHTLLRPLLKGLAVTTDPNQEIQVMLQTLLTDPTLERVLRATDPKSSSMSSSQMQDAIVHFRKNILLKNLPAKDLYSISYRDRDPAHAKAVAQTLVSILIDSSLGGQRRDADQVGTFLDNQIANYETKLEAADKRRAGFKAAHLEFFASTPNGDRVSGAGDVVGARAAVTQAQNTLSEAVDRRNSLRAQLGSTPKILDVNSPLPAIMDRSGTAITHRSQLAAAIAKLNMLRTRFTDDYPDVVAQKRLIARLKSQESGDSPGTEGISNPGYVMIMSKLADTESEVVVDRNRLKDAQKRLENAKKMAEKAITVQREYENLDRDYQVLHKNYEALVTRRESAKITQAAGNQQSAFVFRVISPPLKPNRPDAPNRLLLNAAVLLLGVGSGAGLAFALGQFSGRFLSIEQLKEAFELPILGAITTVRTSRDMAAAQVSITLFGAGLGLLVVSCLVILFYSHSGMGVGLEPSL